ncbi:MAG: GWxTD domain-containing protein, partial [Marinoscillum sp.]
DNTYGSKFRAKAAIKNFYDQIEIVNRLFTDYKQGWKTDRGMIYLIFGAPHRVFRSERSEIWQYIDGTEFEFIRISTLFTPSMYSLKRSRDYEELWYERVGEIRRGI